MPTSPRSGCGRFCTHVVALSLKNAQLKRRAPLTLLLEVAIPVLIVALMLALKTLPALQDQVFPSAQYVGPEVLHALALGTAPRRLADANFVVAVLPASAADAGSAAAAKKFLADMSALHPPLNFSSVGGGRGLLNPALRKLYVPGFADVAMAFADDAALAAYIAAKDYPRKPGVWAAVVFNSAPPSAVGWDYSVRLNASDATNTNGLPVNTFVTRYQQGPINGYVYSKGPQLRKVTTMQGFVTLQLAVDRWIVNRNVSTDALDELTVVATVAESIGLLSSSLATNFLGDLDKLLRNDTLRLAAVMADLREWLRAETFAPQQVNFVPFPTGGYKLNLFYTVVLPNLTLLFVIAYLVPVTRLVRGLVVEKELRLREVMRTMGLNQAAHFLSWVGMYAAIYALIALCIAAIGTQIFPKSSFVVIFALFFAFGLSSTTFCVLVSVFFSRSRTATVLGGVCFFAAFFAFFGISSSENPSRPTLLGGALLAPTALGLAMDVLGSLESNGVGATSSTLFVDAGTSGLWSAGASLLMMLFDTVLYAVLAWYADAVLPARLREFGVPRPFYFCCTPSFFREDVCGYAPRRRAPKDAASSSVSAAGGGGSSGGGGGDGFLSSLLSQPQRWLGAEQRRRGAEPSLVERADSSFFEEPDANLRAKEAAGRCVQLRGLRKEFATPDGVKVAVDSVDLTMFDGQIFVLLGHNGAGKTTTISMLTGMTAPTSGEMSVFGRDVGGELAEIRRDLGVCPQHDVLWPDLTVREHLQLYGALKGVPPAEREEAAAKALALVGLTEKVDALAETLSGGMKRKLSVAVAFLGGSRVVLLDEPTSGMDPYSRRSTWQILQNAREGRVIVLTTHFMDEADILGDRIAIMAHGQVRCVGSPTWLKQRFGIGYVLTLVRAQHRANAAADAEAALALVRAHVPEASVATNVGAELNLRMPMTSSPAFPAMLSALDARLAELGVVSYGVSVTNIEDIFLKIAQGATAGGIEKVSFAAQGAHDDGVKVGLNPLNAAGFAVASGGAGGGGDGNSESVALAPGASLTPVEAARARGRAEKEALAAFAQHCGAICAKRVNFGRRDVRALLCLLLIPVVLLCAGLSFILVGLNSAPRDLLFSTSGFNAARFNFVTRSASVNPNTPNYVPSFTFKASAAGNASSADVAALVGSVAARGAFNLSTDGGRLSLDAAAAADLDARNSQGWITSASEPTRSFQRMSTFLIENKPSYAASKYGALVFTSAGTVLPAQADGGFSSGAENASTFAVLHNTSAVHAGPIFMNLLNSALWRSSPAGGAAAGACTGPAAACGIATRNHPLPLTAVQQQYALSQQSFSVVQVLLIATCFVPATFITFVVREREVGAKHQQLVSGVGVMAYWLASYAFDAVTYLLPWALSLAIVNIFSVGTLTQREQDHASALTLNLLAFGPAACSFCYMISHLFASHSTAQTVVIMAMILSFAGAIVVFVLAQISSTCLLVPYIAGAARLLPMFALSNSLQQLASMEILPTQALNCDLGNGGAKAASAYAPIASAFDARVTGLGLAYMCVEAVMYLVLAIVFDVALRNPRVRQFLDGDGIAGAAASAGASAGAGASASPGVQAAAAPAEEEVDSDVAAEARRVAAQTASGEAPRDDIVLLDTLRKVYRGGKAAVRGLSFGLPAGEVFGFLGINGAGKTSALKMLSGDILPSSGSASLAGFDIVRQQLQVRRLLGYCPQFDALLDLLSAREHLELYARIKGVPEADLRRVVERQLDEFDLREYAGKLAGTLSGGNKRKLSVAIALIGDVSFPLLRYLARAPHLPSL